MSGRGDFMAQCNPGLKIPVDTFEAQVCQSGCANSLCQRSRYKDDATQAKIAKHERLMTVPESPTPSPLSRYPEGVTPDEASPTDPWAATRSATRKNVDLYKEYADPAQDPWSPSYQGAVDRKAAPGTTIRIPGRRK